MISTYLPQMTLAGLILLASSLNAAVEGTAAERYDLLEKALNGDPEAMATVEQEAASSCFNRWILGSALHRQQKTDQAIEQFVAAARQGDVRAVLALADINRKARRLVDSYAWAQIWLLSHFDMRQIQAGEANQDAGMALLRANLEDMTDSQIEQAETLALEYQEQLNELRNEGSNACSRTTASEVEWESEHRRQPRYPASMARQRKNGWTHSMLLINQAGEVERVAVIYSSNSAFERPTQRALERWQFRPKDGIQPEDGASFVQTIEYVME